MTDPTPEPDNSGLESLGGDDTDLGDLEPSSSEKPFDDTPFDAGVEANEDEDPKTYIQQLAGKLGNSLRKYNKDLGQPDYETEKFAINSVISATHTSEMDEEDQKDIIKKIKTSGAGDDDINVDVNVDTNKSNDGGEDADVSVDGEETDVNVGEEFIGEASGEGASMAASEIPSDEYDSDEELGASANMQNNKKASDAKIKKASNVGKSMAASEIGENKLPIQKKISNLAENKNMLNSEEMTEVEEPVVKPVTKPLVKPETTPSRRSKPFRVPVIKPGESPKPKASN